ncbi:MAG: hypothetical protein EXR72_01455 [Myxococcales bacterium]|nr:hypothetical protein [Myxococcales bacterium]
MFLYNIAQAYRLSNRPPRAIEFYKKYLKLDPAAKKRKEVEQRIAALEASGGPPLEPIAPGTKPQGEPERAVEPVDSPAAPPPSVAPPGNPGVLPAAAITVTATAAPPPRKLWPIWLGVGAGLVVVGVLTALAIVFTRSSLTILPAEMLP